MVGLNKKWCYLIAVFPHFTFRQKEPLPPLVLSANMQYLQCDPVINCPLKALKFIELSIISTSLLSSLHSSSEPVNDALWLNAARACMWRLPDRAEMSWKRRHHGRDSQLRPDRWQDLWCRSIPDGERSVLPARRIQNYVTKVTFSFLELVSGSWYCLKSTLFLKWMHLKRCSCNSSQCFVFSICFLKLKSMESFSRLSIICVMEAQGIILGTEYERMKK